MPEYFIICIAKKNAQVFQREKNNVIKWLNDHIAGQATAAVNGSAIKRTVKHDLSHI